MAYFGYFRSYLENRRSYGETVENLTSPLITPYPPLFILHFEVVKFFSIFLGYPKMAYFGYFRSYLEDRRS